MLAVVLPDPQLPAQPLSVSALLSSARAHERLRVSLANRRVSGQHQPDYAGATVSAQIALDARLQAHNCDPHHADPAWAGDRLSHEAQYQWLRDYVARP